MQLVRSLPARLDWSLAAAWALLAVLSAIVSVPVILNFPNWYLGDWHIMVEAGRRITAGLDPYYAEAGTTDGTWRYSPLLAYVFAFIEPIGRVGWAIVPFAMLPLLRDWRLVAAFLVALPFWKDVESGLSFVELPLVALIAMRGSFVGGLGLVTLALLMPRPMMLPLVVWVLWKNPRLRAPSAVLAVVLTAGAFATGWGDEWVASMVSVASVSAESGQVRLTTLLGPLWAIMPVLAVWLTWRGHLGLASLAISPYWTPAYPMLLVLELDRHLGVDRLRSWSSDRTPARGVEARETVTPWSRWRLRSRGSRKGPTPVS